jgi:hypothetical protein
LPLRETGQFPKENDLKTIAGLREYIKKDLPGSDKILAKLNELRDILANADNNDDDDARAQASAEKILNDEPLFDEKYFRTRRGAGAEQPSPDEEEYYDKNGWGVGYDKTL